MKSLINKVIIDLISHIEDEEETDNSDKPNRYFYDRMEWIKNNKSSGEDQYQIGLESLRVMIYQLGFFKKHITDV
tara:strand:+ start:1000 stop:1224 length:225 start_codon:yes stop_codon:yes gene_type:complete